MKLSKKVLMLSSGISSACLYLGNMLLLFIIGFTFTGTSFVYKLNSVNKVHRKSVQLISVDILNYITLKSLLN